MRDLLSELRWRGLLHDATPGLEDRLKKGPIIGYIGFDPTAESLHVGNLVPVMLLAHLQRAGGTPIALVGGGTGMIGDPSGRSSERPLLTTEDVDRNARNLRTQLAHFLSFSGENAARLVNNADWLRSISLVEFLRDTGKHFTIGVMLQKESVKSRLESGISFTEFSYMLLQAYDFLHLHRSDRCELQMGGSDQWGNITAGIDLIRRVESAEVHALCAPLLTKASGAKFGKSEGGNIWLDATSTSPYRFYQFWINTDDRDVESFLKMFTFLTEEQVAETMATHEQSPAQRHAQRRLARDVTTRVHGQEVAGRVENASKLAFAQDGLETVDAATWDILAQELPAWQTTRSRFPISVVDLLAESGLTTSKGDARRQLKQGGISINGSKVTSDEPVDTDRLLARRFLWLRRGRKTDVIVTVD